MKNVSTSKAYARGYKKSDIILDLLKEITRLFISPEELREFWYFRSPLSFQKQVTQGLRGTSTVERFRAKALKFHRAQFTCPATTLHRLTTFCQVSAPSSKRGLRVHISWNCLRTGELSTVYSAWHMSAAHHSEGFI